jgi:hypothetical protein
MTYTLPKGASGDAVLAGVEYLNKVGEAGREELHVACCDGSGMSRTMSEWLVTKTRYGGCPVDIVWEKYTKNWGDGRKNAYRLTDFGRTLIGRYDPQGRRLKDRLAKKAKIGAEAGTLVRVKPRVMCYTLDTMMNSYGVFGRQFREYSATDPRLGVFVGWSLYFIEAGDDLIFGSYVEGDEELRAHWAGLYEPMPVIIMPSGERIITRMTGISVAKSGGKR